MTTPLRTLPHPVRSWRGMGSAAKLILYTRTSLQITVVSLPLVFLFIFTSNSDFAWPQQLSIAVPMIVSAVSAVAALQVRPELAVEERPGDLRVFRAGFLLHGLLLAGCLAAQLVPGREQLWVSTTVVALACSYNLAMAFLPFLPRPLWSAVGLAALVVGGTYRTLGDSGSSYFQAAAVVFITGTALLSLWTVRLMRDSERARRLEAELRVSEERLRFAQELHDTLGQRLAAMSIKTQLAEKFAERQDPRLFDELRDLRELTGTTTAEMREVVHGYRGINLATEVEGARALLLDAGLTLTVSGSSLDVPEELREVAAWFVRETTTNIIRHANPTRVALTLTDAAVTMSNDGAGAGVDKLGGLGALRRRVEKHDARLLVEQEAGAFTVTLIWEDEA